MSRINIFTLLTLVAMVSSFADSEDPPTFVQLDPLTNRFAITSVTETTNSVTWEATDLYIRFFNESRRMEFNNTLTWLNGPMTTNACSQRVISETDSETVLAPLIQSIPDTKENENFIVVLDPGHGGDDPGAIVQDGPVEKDIVLDVANRVRRKLRSEKISVRMTRRRDKTLYLAKRTELTKKWKGSVQISIHANKASSTIAQGIETFVIPASGFASTSSTKPEIEAYTGNLFNAENTMLSHFIQREVLVKTEATDRGVKRARFEVLKNAPCPAVLIEIGFLSNEDELALLLSDDYQEKIAEGIVNGILTYIQEKTPVPTETEPKPHRTCLPFP